MAFMRIHRRQTSRILGMLVVLCAISAAPSAALACTNPVGNAGDIIYNGDENLLSYCDGTNWISVKGSGRTTGPAATTSGLVAHWKMEDSAGSTVVDQLGNNNGTWQDNTDDAITTEAVPGIDGNALDFEWGDQSFVNIDAGAGTTDLDNLGPMTVCAWVNFESMPGANGPIVDKRGGASFGNGGWQLGYNRAGGERFFFSTNLRDGYLTNFNTVLVGTNQHVCGTWDGTDGSAGVNIYLNGATDNFTAFTDTVTIDDAAYDIEICRDNSSSNFCDGIVDDVRIYNRELSASEISDIYQATGGIDLSLVGHWKLDETSGATITDSGISATNLTWTDAVNNDVTEEAATGRINGAIDFNTGQASTSGGLSDFDLGTTSSMTMAVWFKTTTASGSFFSGGSGNQIANLSLDGGRLRSRIRDDNGVWMLDNNYFGSGLNDDTWHHYAVVVDRTTNRIKTYLDATEMDDRDVSAATGEIGFASSGSLQIGAGAHLIDDVRFYNRALSENEIQSIAAACQDGSMIYNHDHHVAQYCADDDWVAMGPVRAGIDSNLVGHWRLDETSGTTAGDSSGNLNNGTMLGGMDAAVNTSDGKVNTSLNFNGTSNNYINISSAISSSLNKRGTMSAWLYRSFADTTANYPTALGLGLDDNNKIEFFYWALTDEWRLMHTGQGTNTIISNAANTLPQNEWSHITLSWDESVDELKLFVNGKLIGSPATGLGTMTTSTFTQALIGESLSSVCTPTDCLFQGNIDDVRLYNRALSDAEILALYELGNDTPSDLVGHWKLDDLSGTSATDSSGNGNAGTLTNFDTPASWSSSGQINEALSFDGTTNYIEAADSASLDATTQVTISAWVNPDTCSPDTNGTADMRSIAGKWEKTGNNRAYILGMSRGTNCNLLFNISDDGLWGDETANGVVTTDLLSINTWAHVVAVYDGSTNLASIYINGTLSASNTATDPTTANLYNSSAPFRIGAVTNWGDTPKYFSGHIDDVRVYNRALSATEIDALYKLGIGHCTNPVGKEGDVIMADIDPGAGTDNAMLYCDGINWQTVGKTPP